MFNQLLKTLGLEGQPSNDDGPSRRRYTRRSVDQCVVVIGDQAYPVENWSLGGVLLYTDPQAFKMNAPCDVTLKFKLQERIIDVSHAAKVVRKTKDHVAVEFEPLTKQIRGAFQSVVDDYMASQFANSQIV